MATYKIGDRLDRSKLGARLVEPSELFALKWGGKWSPSYRGGWMDEARHSVNVVTINESNEAEVYITSDGLKAMSSFGNVIRSDGPNGPLRITPRLMTQAERQFVNTRSQLSQQTWVSASPSSLVDIVAPYYAEIRCDMPPKPNGSRVGLWRAFWQLVSDQNWQNGPEFDIMEEFGERPAGMARITTGLHSATNQAWSTVDRDGKPNGGALKAAIDAGMIPNNIEYVTTGAASQNLHLDGSKIYTFGGWVDTTGFFVFVDDSGQMVCKWAWPYATDFTGRKSYISADFAIGKGGTGAGDIQPNETTVGTWTIYDIGAYAIGASTPVPTPTPTPVPTPTPTPTPVPTPVAQSISVTTAAVSGKFVVSGKGAGNSNVAAYTADWSRKLSPDVTPNATGAWSLTIDTAGLPAGTTTPVMVAGFSKPAGTVGGTTVTAPLTVNVTVPATPAPTGPSDAVKAAVAALTADVAAIKKALGIVQ